MQRTNVKNVILQAVQRDRLPIMLRKVWARIFDEKGKYSKIENRKWLETHCISFEKYANEHAPHLWEEAVTNTQVIKVRADAILSAIEYDLGGGGIYPLLYFIVRYVHPKVIVETGVAAGFSSYAFLLALQCNGSGRLYSSDFPYFRLPNPERFVGVIVEDSLKNKWELFLDGDASNLPIIAGKVPQIDIFHYDSDKSYFGRRRALKTIEGKMAQNGIILMDDIQDNSFFRDYIETKKIASWHVFEFENKYIGMIGELPEHSSNSGRVG